jgi:hypothetical protein
MDVASSIAGLVALADLVFGKIFWYIKAVKGAEREIVSFSTEVQSLSGILHRVHLIARQLDDECHDHTIRVHHVYYCYETLEKVKDRLQKAFPHAFDKSSSQAASFSSRDHRGALFIGKLKWPFTASETRDLIADVQRHKSTLTLALSVDSLSSLLEALGRQEDIQTSIDGLKYDLSKRWDQEAATSKNREHQEVLRFFCDVDPLQSHEMNLKLRHPGTGIW